MIKKLVIPAAGLGTRFLPATKSLAKEMIPIINVPTIHFIVEEAIKSGIEEILIIVSSQKNSIIDYFDHSYELEHRLLEKNKKKEYEMINNISNMSEQHIVLNNNYESLVNVEGNVTEDVMPELIARIKQSEEQSYKRIMGQFSKEFNKKGIYSFKNK